MNIEEFLIIILQKSKSNKTNFGKIVVKLKKCGIKDCTQPKVNLIEH